MKNSKKNAGFTLFVSIAITGTLLLISTAIVTLAVRQSLISASGRESQAAFYAADTGLECALYWDIQNPSGQSAFSTTTPSIIFCNQDNNNQPNPNPNSVGGNSESNFTITFDPDESCAKVKVIKGPGNATTIESLGYNSCDPANPRRVERAVRATY